MILKIARYKDNRNWWIIDGIRRINYGLEDVGFKDIREVPDISISDWNDRKTTSSMDEKISVMCASCRMNNGDEIYVEFDTLAYLCSDEGGTLEKLVANYNVGEPIVRCSGSAG